MISPPETVIIEETTCEVEEKRGVNPWLIAGGLLFMIAFVLGWRSVRTKKSDGVGAGADETTP